MSRRTNPSRRIDDVLAEARSLVNENPNLLAEPDFLHRTWGQIRGEGSGIGDQGSGVRDQGPELVPGPWSLSPIVMSLLLEAIKTGVQRDQLLAVIKKYQDQLTEQPRLARVVGEEFRFGHNGHRRRMIWVVPVTVSGVAAPSCVCLPEDNTPAPEPLAYIYIDQAGKFFLEPADKVPLSCEENPVVRVELDGEIPGLSEVVIRDGPQRQPVLFCHRELAEEIDARMTAGETVTVRHDPLAVVRVVCGKAETPEDWLEFPSKDGPALEDLVFPPWLRRLWQRDVRKMVRGRTFRVLLIGATGTGKTEAVERAARKAARLANKPLALIRMSLSRVGSSYYSQSEQNIRLVADRARRLAAEGYLVVVLVDEADGLLGNSEGRFESSVNRSVRSTFQTEFSNDIQNVFVYLTMNIRSDSWLPAPLGRRCRKRVYPPACRSQIARVIAGYADPAAMEALGTTATDFGKQVADYLYAESFTIARVWMHSGNQVDVRARSLRDMSPAKVKDLVIDFCEDLADGEATSMQDLWPMLEREFRGTPLSAANLYELTNLPRPANDSVKKVEMLRSGSPAEVIRFAEVG